MTTVKTRRRRKEWLQGDLADSSKAVAEAGPFPLVHFAIPDYFKE